MSTVAVFSRLIAISTAEDADRAESGGKGQGLVLRGKINDEKTGVSLVGDERDNPILHAVSRLRHCR